MRSLPSMNSGHKGIPKTETADVAAKSAAKETTLLNISLSFSDFFGTACKTLDEICYNYLIQIEKNKGVPFTQRNSKYSKVDEDLDHAGRACPRFNA